MANGDLQAPLAKHGIKLYKALCLLFGPGEVGAVGGGEMAEQALRLQPGQGRDPGAGIRVLRRHLKANAAHAGVHSEVEFCRKVQKAGGF